MISEWGISPGTILHNQYVVADVLGEGGFGITYLAEKRDTGENVAIKEYFPFQLAVRREGALNLVVLDRKKEEDYIRGKRRFVKEATILEEYRYLQGIVKIWDCFEANNTAYIVMDYIEGITLKEYIFNQSILDYPELMEMLSPILKSLAALHRHGVIHRDISPDNLMIGIDNQLYLIDFGAAREVEYGKTATVLLKAGYAPPEQYIHDGVLGAWTDVYALCATIYMALSGKVPTDAVARLQGRELVPLTEYGMLLEDWQWNAIKKGMSMRAAERFRSMEDLYDALTVEPMEEELQTVTIPEMELPVQKKMHRLNENGQEAGKKKRVWLGIQAVMVACILVVLYGGNWWLGLTGQRETEASFGEGKSEIQADTTNRTEDTEKERETSEDTERKLCRMPNVVGMTGNAAIDAIAKADGKIKVRTVRKYSNDEEINVVMEQSVEPDTQYNEGMIEEVILTISDGAEPVTESRQKTPAGKTGKQSGEPDSYNVKSDGNEAVDFYLDD